MDIDGNKTSKIVSISMHAVGDMHVWSCLLKYEYSPWYIGISDSGSNIKRGKRVSKKGESLLFKYKKR